MDFLHARCARRRSSWRWRRGCCKRSLNEGFSGGEKKRNEVLQMAVLEPKLAILDETDSGLDIDALRIVAANGVNALRSPERSMLVITHYQRLLDYIVPDVVHVLAGGRIVKLRRQGARSRARGEGLRLDRGGGGVSALEKARDALLAAHESFVATRSGDPAWLATHRRDAIAAFADRGLPTTRDEEWRYTNLAPLAGLSFAPAAPTTLDRGALEELATPLFACSLYAFANGHAVPELSAAPGLPGGARCDSLAALFSDGASPAEARLDHYVDIKAHPFAALNAAFAQDGAVVRTPRASSPASSRCTSSSRTSRARSRRSPTRAS